jgi:hypothetical protein
LTRIESSAFSSSSLRSIIFRGMLKLLYRYVFNIVNHFHQSHLNQIHD